MNEVLNKVVSTFDHAKSLWSGGRNKILSSSVAKSTKLGGKQAWDRTARVASDVYARSGINTWRGGSIIAGSAAAGAGVGAYNAGPDHRFSGAIKGGLLGGGLGAGYLGGMGAYKSARQGVVHGMFRDARASMASAVGHARARNTEELMSKMGYNKPQLLLSNVSGRTSRGAIPMGPGTPRRGEWAIINS